MRRATPFILLLAFTIVLAGGIVFGRMQKARTMPQMSASGMKQETITLKGQRILVDVALTQAEQARGLGGRTGLGANEGMLFVFGTDAKYPFWMKDMHFPIDILWLSSSGEVVSIVPDLSPDTYPKSYAPDAPARYVLELPAGWSSAHGVKVGDAVEL